MLAALIVIIALGVLTMTTMRRRHAQKERDLALELERARAEADRVKQFLAGEPQIVVVWDRADAEPRVEGEFALVSDAMNPRRILSFSGWLDAGDGRARRRYGGQAAVARRGLLGGGGEPQGPSSGARRPRHRRQRRHAHPRHFRRPAGARAPAGELRRGAGRTRRLSQAPRRASPSRLDARARRPPFLAQRGFRARAGAEGRASRWTPRPNCSTARPCARPKRRAPPRGSGARARTPPSPARGGRSRPSRSPPRAARRGWRWISPRARR